MLRLNSMKAKLKSRQEIAGKFCLIEFDTLGQPVDFEPGQFFNLTLLNPPLSDGRGNSRYFGFTNTPGETVIQMIMKQGTSAFKKTLQALPIGTEVEIDKIGGKIDLSQNPSQLLIFIVDSIGIAPVISIIRFIKDKNLNYKITLIYVNSEKESALFFDELKTAEKVNPFFKLIPVTVIDGKLIQNNFKNLNDNLYFVKGEQKFVVSVIKILKDFGIEINKISPEIFTGY